MLSANSWLICLQNCKQLSKSFSLSSYSNYRMKEWFHLRVALYVQLTLSQHDFTSILVLFNLELHTSFWRKFLKGFYADTIRNRLLEKKTLSQVTPRTLTVSMRDFWETMENIQDDG